jgi:carboxyl-terminal processing protease
MRRPPSIRSFSIFAAGFAAALAALLLLQAASAGPKRYSPYRKLDIFAQVLTQVENNYVEHVDDTKLIYGALQGMMRSLDPHSAFMPPEVYRQIRAETQGEFGGIGVEVELRDGWLTVVSPLQGTPAHKAGLKPGDQIRGIDGKSTEGFTMFQAVKAMRGARGTAVELSIGRKGLDKPLKVKVVRDLIKIVSVSSKLLRPGIGYVRLKNFQEGTDKQLDRALDALEKSGPLSGLLLDLRNNPGGLLDQAVRVSDLFIKAGLIVSTAGKGRRVLDEERAHSMGTRAGFPIICLVNGGSASASEIVAGALQDHKRAVVLGGRTFGKGSVQTIIDLEDGSGLKLTIARYYTPKGRSIQEKGIDPDIVVPEREPPQRVTKVTREKDLKGHLGKEGKEPVKAKAARLDDFQLQTALDYLQAAHIFRQAKTR